MRRMSILGFGLVVAIGALTVALPVHANRALLIGVGQYAGKISSLSGPPRDVALMQEFLLEWRGYDPDEIETLLDQQSTRDGILAGLARLTQTSKPGEKVFIYYSGHGTTIPDANGDEEDGLDEVLVPYDAILDENNPRFVSDDEIEVALERLRDREVTMVVDSCHSGTISRSLNLDIPSDDETTKIRSIVLPGQLATPTLPNRTRAFERTFVQGNAGSKAADRSVWTAASPNQLAWETGGFGVFTRHFVLGQITNAADSNSNGVVTAAELLDYTRRESERWCLTSEKCQKKGLGLTPTHEGSKTLVVAALAQPTKPPSPSPSPAPGNTGGDVPIADPTGHGPINASDVLGMRNDAGLRIEILPRTRVRAREVVSFRVSARQDGWLVLLFVDSRRKLMQLYPNQHAEMDRQRWNWIRAGAPLTVPDAYYGFRFRADPDALGKGQLIAILLQDEVALKQLLREHAALEPVSDPVAYLNGLAEALRSLQVDDGRYNRATAWSVAYTGYEVVP